MIGGGRSGDCSHGERDDTNFMARATVIWLIKLNTIDREREREKHVIATLRARRTSDCYSEINRKKKTIEMHRFENRRRMKAKLMRELKIKVQFMQWKPMIDAFDCESYAILIHGVFFSLSIERKKSKEKTQLFDYRPAPNQIFLTPFENNRWIALQKVLFV